MIPLNPGNILKFSDSREMLRHYQEGQNRVPFGLRAPNTRLIPFQVFFPVTVTSATWKLVEPTDTIGIGLAMTAGDLDIVHKDGGGSWVTWYPGSNLTTIPDCGYREIWLTVNSITYYSEVLHLFEANEFSINEWRFEFDNNNTDKGTVLYQQGYKQHFYPTKWVWDRPAIEREIEEEIDGNDNITSLFSRTVSRFRLEVPDLPDYVLTFFAKCGDIATVKFENSTGFPSITMQNVAFEFRNQGNALNIGIFTFDAEIESFNGCQENFVLT
jgi:hypothetical protein